MLYEHGRDHTDDSVRYRLRGRVRLARDAGVSVSEYVRKASIREDKSSIDDAISKLEKTLGRKIYGR